MPDTFDPLNLETLSRPQPMWKAMRDDAPVRRVYFPNTDRPIFLVSRKADVQAVAGDPKTYSSMVPSDIWRWGDLGPALQPLLTALGWPIVHTIASADPPLHGGYRKLVNPIFAPVKISRMAISIGESIRDLLDGIAPDEPFDFMTRYAIPLPIMMIGDMLGLPRSEQDLVQRFTDVFVRMVDPTSSGALAAKAVEEFAEGQLHLAAYLERFQKEPNESVLSLLANAQHEDGHPYSMEERLSLAYLLVAAGNETTRNGLSLCAYHLAADPALWQALREDRSKVPVFVEETLRVGTPATLNPRLVMRDAELAGERLPEGAVVFILWGSANRDEAAFAHADEIRLDRANPRNHMAFGYGIHSCVGAPLARRELTLSVEAWLERYSAWEFAVPRERIQHEPLFGFRTFAELPIIVRR